MIGDSFKYYLKTSVSVSVSVSVASGFRLQPEASGMDLFYRRVNVKALVVLVVYHNDMAY
jgi:hypothetical protein